jgi:hypothetical protein
MIHIYTQKLNKKARRIFGHKSHPPRFTTGRVNQSQMELFPLTSKKLVATI